MIPYFSGTGSSEYAAERIGEEINDEIMNLKEKIRSRSFSGIYSDTPWVVAAPTCAWGIPRILQEWLKKTELTRDRNIYFVMIYDGNTGNVGKYLKKLTDAKGLGYQSRAQIVMSENYTAVFTTPTRKEAAGIIRRSQGVTDKAVQQVELSRPSSQVPVT